jgi:DNA-binding NtrC family response regulator
VSQLLLVTKEKSTFSALTPVIEKEGGKIHWAANAEKALDAVGKNSLDAVVVDEKLEDMTGLALIEKIISVNPMINSALVSSLDKKAYHEASEGLGVLMQLPPDPTERDGEQLMSKLNQVIGFISSTSK